MGSPDEDLDLTGAHQVDHMLEIVAGRAHADPGVRVTAGAGSVRIMSRSIRVGEACTISNSSPRTMKRSPALGIRPAHSTSKPAIVVDRPGGSETPNRSSRTSTGMFPSVSYRAGPLVAGG